MNRFSCGLEVKLAGDDKTMAFEGYGAVFGDVDLGGDVIVKGAFKDTIKLARKTGVWPSMLFEHGGFLGSDAVPIGVWDDLEEDDRGLKVKGVLADTDRGRETYQLLKMQPRPAINGLSIGYVTKESTIGTRPGEPRRTLKKIDLFEISLVNRPMQPQARVGRVKSKRELELALRDAGLSREEAKGLLSCGYAGLGPRDASADGDLAAIERLVSTIENL